MGALFQLRRFLLPYWHWSLIAPLLMVGEVALDLCQPSLVRRIIDQGIAHHDLLLVQHTLILMFAISILAMICGGGCGYFATQAAFSMGADLRGALFRKVQTLSFSNLDKLETGGLITRLTSDVNQVQEMVNMMMRGMVRMPLLLTGSLAMAVVTSPKLGIIFMVVLPVLVTALVLIIRQTFPLYRQVQKRLDSLNTVLQENLAGVRVVKAFGRRDHESKRFSVANNSLIEQAAAATRMGARTMPVMMLTLNAGIVGALWIGGQQVVVHRMQVGEVVAFINYLGQALMSLMMVSMLIIQVSRAQASARRVADLLETKPVLKKPDPRAKNGVPRGRIVFEHVNFSYSATGQDPVLKDINFVAEPGETVAILGATGAGKTTLVQLIPRFYEVTSGRVTLDGVDVRHIPEEQLRELVGVSLQEPILFSDKIRQNVALARPEASLEEIMQVSGWAQADEFVQRFPEGYDTVVGQRGVNLSGGQKQRLAIARALLPQTPVLILDDSTSAVDVRTEGRIQDSLQRNQLQQTRIIVAQRISAAVHADKIIVLEDGRIAAQGTHEELLEDCSIYQEIYQSQTEQGVLIHGGD